MLTLFRSKPEPRTFEPLITDIHAHLLPGLDNGAEDMSEAVTLVSGLRDLGFSHIYCTPHVRKSLPGNTTERLSAVFEALRRGLSAAGLTIEVSLAAEYLLDEGFEDLLEANSLLCLPGKRLLVELQPNRAEVDLRTLLFNLRIREYLPVLAHPERYHFLPNYKKVLSKWHERGYEMQVDILSLTGYHGAATRETAVWMLKNDLISSLASNVHNRKELELLNRSLESSKVRDAVRKIGEKGGNL
ncbi:MAG: tyrosine-protein phosphatase [Bacteroidota bacterium]